MNEFSGVNFHPWIGEHYRCESRFQIKLLVLGESHYWDDPNSAACDFTQWVVRKWGQKERARFFTVIANVLRGEGGWINDHERSEIWENVAFYNFVQSFVGDSPGQQPTFQQWCDAQAPFKIVLRCLEPDAVLILGCRLSEHVVHRPENVTFGEITHPRGGLAYKDGIPAFQDMLRAAGGTLWHAGA